MRLAVSSDITTKLLGERLSDNLIVTTLGRCLSHDKKSQVFLQNSFGSFEAAMRPSRSVTSSAILPLPSKADGFSSEK